MFSLPELGDWLDSFSKEAFKTQGISFTELLSYVLQLLKITVNCLKSQSVVVITIA